MPITNKYYLRNRGESYKIGAPEILSEAEYDAAGNFKHKGGAFESFKGFIDYANEGLYKEGKPLITEDSERYKFLLNTWGESGKHYVRQHEDETYRANYKPSKRPWEHIDVGHHVSFAPDTVEIRAGNVRDFLEEEAHAYQFKAPQSIRDSLMREFNIQHEKFGELKYGYEDMYPLAVPPEQQPGELSYGEEEDSGLMWGIYEPVIEEPRDEWKLGVHRQLRPTIPAEFEAHSIIAPAMWKDYDAAEALDWMQSDIDPSKAYRTNFGVELIEALSKIF